MPVKTISETIRSDNSYDNVVFKDSDNTKLKISGVTFSHCIFQHCIFTETIFTRCYFENCKFMNCTANLSKYIETTIPDGVFEASSFIGADFTKIKTLLGFSISFVQCDLSFAQFSQLAMPKSSFIRCNLKDADFTEAKLAESSFLFSSLVRTIFARADLYKADLRGAKDYVINPKDTSVKKARFSQPDVMSFLDVFEIKVEEPPEESND